MNDTSRIALVTGAGRGIGRATALGLAAAGLHVVAAARGLEELHSLVEQIEREGGRATAFPTDLSDREAPRRLIDLVGKRCGRVDVLVNNAGVGSSQDPRPLVEFDDAFWDLTFDVNVRAPYQLTKALLPAMLTVGWGRVINIASINARVAAMHGAAYTASKHALAGLTKATAKETAGTGVTANAVCPGVTATRMNDLRLEYDARRTGQTLAELEQLASPLGRRLTPDEVAAMVVFLASDAAGAITGQCINVCGGAVTS